VDGVYLLLTTVLFALAFAGIRFFAMLARIGHGGSDEESPAEDDL
jgi:hypothetical protein